MLPSNAPNSLACNLASNTIPTANVCVGEALRMQYAHRFYDDFGQACVQMGLSPKRVINATALLNHITRVVPSGAKKEVIRVYAIADVARMAHKQALRNRAVCKLPRHAVGKLFFTRDRNNTVPMYIESASPKPTAIGRSGFIYTLLKAFRQRYVSSAPFSTVITWLTGQAQKYLATCRAGAFCSGTFGSADPFGLGWYTSHVVASNKVTANPRVLVAPLGFSMPNYSIDGGTK